jgi:hypothetical protein
MSVAAHVAPCLLPPLAQLVASYDEDTYRFVEHKIRKFSLPHDIRVLAEKVAALGKPEPGECLCNVNNEPQRTQGVIRLSFKGYGTVVRCRHGTNYGYRVWDEKWMAFPELKSCVISDRMARRTDVAVGHLALWLWYHYENHRVHKSRT